jgi:hypothetical protein
LSKIEIDVKAKNDSKAAFADLKMSADDIKGELKRLGEASKQVQQDMLRLDTAASKNKASLRDLAGEFARAEDAASKLKIADKMKEIQNELDHISKIKKIKLDELIDLKGDEKGLVESAAEAGEGWISSFGSKVSGAVSTIAGPIGEKFGESFGAQAGVVAAPFLVSALGGALSAGAGALGIGGAVALAIKSDSELTEAGADLGKRLFGSLTQSAHTAFAEPLRLVFGDMEKYIDQISDQWKDAFEDLAPSLRPLANDVGKAIAEISGSIARIAGDSGPALEVLGDGLVSVATAAGHLLESLAGQDAAAQDLQHLFDIMTGAITVMDLFVQGLGAMGGGIESLKTILGPFASVPIELAEALGQATDESRDFAAKTGDQAAAAQLAADAANAEKTALQGLNDMLKAQTDPVFAVIDAHKRLHDAQENYNSAVKKNGKNSEQAASALAELAKAGINMEGAVEGAAGALDGQVSPALRNTLRAAGLTEDQIAGVAKAFRGARKAGQDFEGRYVAQIKAGNVQSAIDQINDAKNAARAYEGQYVAALRVKISKFESGQMAHGGIAGQAAHGATSSGLTWVGEHGAELVDLPPGARVYSAGDSKRKAAEGGAKWGPPGGGGPSVPAYVIVQLDGHTIARATVDPLRNLISSGTGGDVQRFLGSE